MWFSSLALFVAVAALVPSLMVVGQELEPVVISYQTELSAVAHHSKQTAFLF